MHLKTLNVCILKSFGVCGIFFCFGTLVVFCLPLKIVLWWSLTYQPSDMSFAYGDRVTLVS